jgi:hypothetical protein
MAIRLSILTLTCLYMDVRETRHISAQKQFRITASTLCGTRYFVITFSPKFIADRRVQVFTFNVNFPDVAHLMFRVMDEDVKQDDFVGFASIPVHALRPGFRSVYLFDAKGGRLGEMQYATLFIRVSVGDPIVARGK